MNDKQYQVKRIEMAKWLGWRLSSERTATCNIGVLWNGEEAYVNWTLPDFRNDWQHIMWIQRKLSKQQRWNYQQELRRRATSDDLYAEWYLIDATPMTRFEALCTVLGI